VRLSVEPSLNPSDYPFSHEIRVRFAETDAMGIVHHASYLPYLEESRVAYLRAAGHPYASLRAEGVDIAVLELATRYIRPLRFDDVVTVSVAVASVTRATMQLAYLLSIDGVAHSTGVTVHGCVNRDGRPVRLPDWFASLVHTPTSSTEAVAS
jgi:acyl-CoA thioester hydrolase